MGSLVVLSGFMLLLLGATPAQAETGQDPRCDGYTGIAMGLCTAAVSEGCFDGVVSADCDDLTTNWTEHCSTCEEIPPWIQCPCNYSAEEITSLFPEGATLSLIPNPGAPTGCDIQSSYGTVWLAIGDDTGAQYYGEVGFAGPPSPANYACSTWTYMIDPPVSITLHLTPDQYSACEAALLQAATDLGFTCTEY
jgi:hypothetical protein